MFYCIAQVTLIVVDMPNVKMEDANKLFQIHHKPIIIQTLTPGNFYPNLIQIL